MLSTLLVGGVALAAGAALGVLVLGPMLGSGRAGAAAAEADAIGPQGGDAPTAPPQHLFLLDNFIVNPAETEGTRFLMMTLAVEVDAAASVELLRAREAEIRDILIRVVGTRTVRELADVSLRGALVEDVRGALLPLTGPGVVRRILIPQFVIQ